MVIIARSGAGKVFISSLINPSNSLWEKQTNEYFQIERNIRIFSPCPDDFGYISDIRQIIKEKLIYVVRVPSEYKFYVHLLLNIKHLNYDINSILNKELKDDDNLVFSYNYVIDYKSFFVENNVNQFSFSDHKTKDKVKDYHLRNVLLIKSFLEGLPERNEVLERLPKEIQYQIENVYLSGIGHRQRPALH